MISIGFCRSKSLLKVNFKCYMLCQIQVLSSHMEAVTRTLNKLLNDSKSVNTVAEEVFTYEFSENLLNTPSDGIDPTRKLLDTLLQNIQNVHYY